jgi:hypothetical protein
MGRMEILTGVERRRDLSEDDKPAVKRLARPKRIEIDCKGGRVLKVRPRQPLMS